MATKAHVIHRLEHRVRLKLPEMKGETRFFDDVRGKLMNCENVDEVSVNPVTGSILIHHDGDLEQVASHARNEGIFDLIAEVSGESEETWPDLLVAKLKRADEKIEQVTDGKMNLSSVTSLIFLGLGSFQVMRRHYLPAASTLLSEALWLARSAPKRRD